MPEGVVDVLEAVEVEEQRRELLAVARGVGQGDRQVLVEQVAIRERRELVVVGEEVQHLLVLLAGGDIVQQHEVSAHGSGRVPVGHIVHFEVAQHSVAPALAALVADLASRQHLLQMGLHHLERAGIDQLADRSADELVARRAHPIGIALIGVDDPQLRVGIADHRRHRVHDRPQLPLALLDCLLGTDPLDRDAGDVAGGVQQVQVFAGRSARAAVIRGERAEHLAGGGRDAYRPAGAQAVPQRELLVVDPQRVEGDVGGHHRLAAPRCRSAGSGGRVRSAIPSIAALYAMGRLGEAVQCRCAMVVEQQDRAQQVGPQRLDAGHQRVEDARQPLAGGDHLQQLLLRTGLLLGQHRGGDVLRLQQDHVGPADRIAQALGRDAVPAQPLLRAYAHSPGDRLAARKLGVDLLRSLADPACEVVGIVFDRPERRDGGRIAHQGRAVQAMDGDLRAGMVECVEIPAQRGRQVRAGEGLPFCQNAEAPILQQDPGGRDGESRSECRSDRWSRARPSTPRPAAALRGSPRAGCGRRATCRSNPGCTAPRRSRPATAAGRHGWPIPCAACRSRIPTPGCASTRTLEAIAR